MSATTLHAVSNPVETTKPNQHKKFDLEHTLHELKHYLPAQAPLKDFIHHNTLHAFQKIKFDDALRQASVMFGYKVRLPLSEYRKLYNNGTIHPAILDKVIDNEKGIEDAKVWKEKLLNTKYSEESFSRIGALRAQFKWVYHLDLDSIVHPRLFRILSGYLDQGISMWDFPVTDKSFLNAMREMEKKFIHFFFQNRKSKKFTFCRTHFY